MQLKHAYEESKRTSNVEGPGFLLSRVFDHIAAHNDLFYTKDVYLTYLYNLKGKNSRIFVTQPSN